MSNEDIIAQLLEQNARLIELLSCAIAPAKVPAEQVVEQNIEITNPRGAVAPRWMYKKQRLEKLFGREIIRHANDIGETIRSDAGSDARVDNGVGSTEGSGERVRGEDPNQ